MESGSISPAAEEAYIFTFQGPHIYVALAIFHHPKLAFRHEVYLFCKCMSITPINPAIEVPGQTQ